MNSLTLETLSRRPVLHVDAGREWRGGQAQVLNLCDQLHRRGVALILVAPPASPLSLRAREKGLPVIETPLRGEFDLLAAWKIRRLIRERGVALIHAHDAHAHSIARLALGRSAVSIPLVVSRRVDFPVSRGFFSRRKYLDPRIRFLAISNGVRRVLIEGGVPPERVRVVPSGVDASRLDFSTPRGRLREELGVPADAPIVGTIGSLVDHKGHRWLVEAVPAVLKRHPGAHFVIVGEGELRPALESQIRSLGLEASFHLPGFREDLSTFLAGFDVFALPSHLEGLCTSLIDAMLFRLPVAATNAGGIPDLAIHDKTALVVEPRRADLLAAAIARLLDDRALAKRLGEAARLHALEGFTMESTAEKTLEAYAEILGTIPHPAASEDR
jgi:glycosyltransferase involved in cell wall biosynthesis